MHVKASFLWREVDSNQSPRNNKIESVEFSSLVCHMNEVELHPTSLYL